MSTVFNTVDKTSNITLSNANLTATDSNTSNAGVRGTTSKSSGKVMLQFTNVTLVDSLDYIGVGTIGDTLGLAQGSQVQVIKITNGTTFSGDGVGGTNSLTGVAVPAGATVDLCLDLTALKSWWRINGGDWNGSPTNNPATGVGGNPIGKSDTYFPYIRLTGTSATATLNPSPTGVPSGFTKWDATPVSVENVVIGGSNGATNGPLAQPSYSNSGANRVVVMQIGLAVAGTTPAAVSGITGGGLTWNKRHSLNNIEASDSNTIEVWWAYASAQVTSQVFSVSFTGTPRVQAIIMFSVAGADTPSSPWDADASLPAMGVNGTLTNSTPSNNTGTLSTSSSTPLLITTQATRTATTQTAPSGFNQMGPTNQEPSAGSDRSYLVGGWKSATGQQSGQTFSGGPSEGLWSFMADAIAVGAPPSPNGPWASTEAKDAFSGVGHPGAAGIVGDLTSTESPDTFFANGFERDSGVWVSTEAPDTFSAFGRQPVTGTFVATGTPDHFAATGIGRGEDGIFVSTESPDTFAAVGHTPVSGVLAAHETPDRFIALGAGVTRVRRRRDFFVT